MANLVKQFRFYSDSDVSKNQPTDVGSTGYINGNVLKLISRFYNWEYNLFLAQCFTSIMQQNQLLLEEQEFMN